MADLLTRQQVLKRIEELQTLARRMPKTSRACIKCDCLYDAPVANDGSNRYRNYCWCDFESDRS